MFQKLREDWEYMDTADRLTTVGFWTFTAAALVLVALYFLANFSLGLIVGLAVMAAAMGCKTYLLWYTNKPKAQNMLFYAIMMLAFAVYFYMKG